MVYARHLYYGIWYIVVYMDDVISWITMMDGLTFDYLYTLIVMDGLYYLCCYDDVLLILTPLHGYIRWVDAMIVVIALRLYSW